MTAFFERISQSLPLLQSTRAEGLVDALTAAWVNSPATAAAAELLQSSARVRTLLLSTFAAAPYLAALAERDPPLLAEILLRDPDAHLASAARNLAEAIEGCASTKDAMAELRRFKKRMALLVALADIGGVWSTEEALIAMSAAGETAVAQAVLHLFRQAHARGELESPEAKGYFVLALGKLGARELNYSSDIDLIVFYDPHRTALACGVEPSTFFVRLTRELVRMLQEHSGDGYVFRTDLRLRPDPGATQIALSTDAALTYYESFGQNWERAAMIKACVVAGDKEAGRAFLRHLSPFVWRRYLDYAAIADIHAMKRRVHEHKGHGTIRAGGHNIKLGRGGIRDIEFFVQTQQLIAGGRHPELRKRGTLAALAELAAGGWTSSAAAADLTRAYLFLRRVENRLQMVEDQQTHVVPSDPQAMASIAALCGYDSAETFCAALLAELSRVETHYGALFEALPKVADAAPRLVLPSDENDPAALASLEGLGFTNPREAIATLRAWQSGRYVAMRSGRARERLAAFLPDLLEAFGRTAEPDLALSTFDKVVASLPAGVQLFSLLAANPSLTRLIADVMGTAPRLAAIIGRRPRLLDAVLDPGFFGALPEPAKLRDLVTTALSEAGDYQDALDRARIVGREQGFLIGVRILSGTVSPKQAGYAYSTLADTLIDILAGRVGGELERQHGRLPEGQAAILALGKLGGHEMTAASDLDLITIYDFAGGAEHSDGAKPLSGTQYYTRYTQRLIAALSAQTAEGSLYQVDMRLRPSGNQGPVATKLTSFADYQERSAWTWEHLALTRARVVSGPPELRHAIESVVECVLRRKRDRAEVAAEVRTMRDRIEEEKGTRDIWDLKQVRGGLIDLEFTVQFLQLITAHQDPSVLDTNTAGAVAKLRAAGAIDDSEAEILATAATLLHALTQCLRLCLDKPFVPDDAPRALKELLARASEMPDFETLQAKLRETLAGVHQLFEKQLR